jgi:hypothetical protein
MIDLVRFKVDKYMEIYKYIIYVIFLNLVKRDFFIQMKSKTKIVVPLLALSLVLSTTIISTTILPFQAVNAQLQITTKEDKVSPRIIGTLLVPGFNNQYNLTIKGNTIPVKYSILDAALVGILSDPTRNSLDLAVNPGGNGGALEVNLPRHVIDAKNAAGQDTPFIVKIDGQRISGEPSGICVGNCPNIFNSFKETQNTNTDRVLTVIFGPESRFIEIIGNKTGT